MPRHRYYYSNRPPDIGCQPDKWVERVTWMPKRAIPDDGDHMACGWVEYDHPLMVEQVWRYDLRPADPGERARYVFYLEADRDEAEAQAMIDDYLSASDAELERLVARGDYLAEMARVLKRGES